MIHINRCPPQGDCHRHKFALVAGAASG